MKTIFKQKVTTSLGVSACVTPWQCERNRTEPV